MPSHYDCRSCCQGSLQRTTSRNDPLTDLGHIYAQADLAGSGPRGRVLNSDLARLVALTRDDAYMGSSMRSCQQKVRRISKNAATHVVVPCRGVMVNSTDGLSCMRSYSNWTGESDCRVIVCFILFPSRKWIQQFSAPNACEEQILGERHAEHT